MFIVIRQIRDVVLEHTTSTNYYTHKLKTIIKLQLTYVRGTQKQLDQERGLRVVGKQGFTRYGTRVRLSCKEKVELNNYYPKRRVS